MPIKLPIKLTPSRVSQYQDCPRLFFYKYLGAPYSESGAASSAMAQTSTALSFGNTLHAVLEDLHRPSPGDVGSLLAQETLESRIDGLLSLHWHGEGYPDEQSQLAAYEEARSILKYYVKSRHTPTGLVLGTELYLTCHTRLAGQSVELSARFDRVELLPGPEGILECLDYKTSRGGNLSSATSRGGNLPSANVLADQLSGFLYFTLAWKNWRDDPRVNTIVLSQLNLLTLSKTRVEYSQRHIVTHKAALTELVAAIAAEKFEPRPNRNCPWCPVRQSCPVQATSLDMAELDGFEDWRLSKQSARNETD